MADADVADGGVRGRVEGYNPFASEALMAQADAVDASGGMIQETPVKAPKAKLTPEEKVKVADAKKAEEKAAAKALRSTSTRGAVSAPTPQQQVLLPPPIASPVNVQP